MFTAVGVQCLQLQESVFVAAGRSVLHTKFAVATGEFWQ